MFALGQLGHVKHTLRRLYRNTHTTAFCGNCVLEASQHAKLCLFSLAFATCIRLSLDTVYYLSSFHLCLFNILDFF